MSLSRRDFWTCETCQQDMDFDREGYLIRHVNCKPCPPHSMCPPTLHIADRLGDRQAGTPCAQMACLITNMLPSMSRQLLQDILDDINLQWDDVYTGTKVYGSMKFKWGIMKTLSTHQRKNKNMILRTWVKVEEVDDDNVPLRIVWPIRHADEQPASTEGMWKQIQFVQQTIANMRRRGGFCTLCDAKQPPRKKLRAHGKFTCCECYVNSGA